jgi:hypothetical protein
VLWTTSHDCRSVVSYYARSDTIVFGQTTLVPTLEKIIVVCQKQRGHFVCDDLQAWQWVTHSYGHFKVSQAVYQPVHGSSLFKDEKRCLLDPERCTFVYRSMDSLKKHWRAVHKWTATGRRGAAASLHVSLQKQANAWKAVRCQRFFHTGRHTSYFTVLSER